MKRHPSRKKGDTTKDFDFKNDIGFVSEIYTKNDQREKTEGFTMLTKAFNTKKGIMLLLQ